MSKKNDNTLSDAEVLKTCIEIVLQRGFDIQKEWGYDPSIWTNRSEAAKIVFCENLLRKDYTNYKSVIYGHEFAKKLFGEEEYVLAIYPLGEYDNPSAIWHSPEDWKRVQEEDDRIDDELVDDETPAWKYHLAKMVIEKDDISYLRDYLKEQKLI